MYGLLFESIQHYIKEDYGEEDWLKILEHAGLKNMVFTTHNVYKDQIMLNLASSCSHVLKDRSKDEYLGFFGTCFVNFCANYGYDKILRVAGRNYRDFLNGIDNLHETIRFSYPRLKSPSFIVDSEDARGCVLVYRSIRQGFAPYVIGQLRQCAKQFYRVNVDVILLEQLTLNGSYRTTFRLNFDNIGFKPEYEKKAAISPEFKTINSDTFFKLFPFCIVFDSTMTIKHVGESLSTMMGEVRNSRITDRFTLRRPRVEFKWDNIINFQSVIFELEAGRNSVASKQNATRRCSYNKRLLLKGQLKYLPDLKMIAFLCTPLITDLEDMQKTGLYMNDLNMFDNSQEMVLCGWHNASQLEHRVDQQVEASRQIAENLQKLDQWRRKGDTLLYSMMPRSIAIRLKNGEDPINTCETFECVSIMFCYLVGFTEMCARASALQIVGCINNVFIFFDDIVDRYKLFKVETLGDAVYMVAGGVPDRQPDHAQRVARLALEFLEKAKTLKDPLSGNNLKARIGMHIGSIAAGLVGRKTPQYCLFGDTVNTAARMQSYSEPGRIHISQPCKESLYGKGFIIRYRGYVHVKGKGEQTTYWLEGTTDDRMTQIQRPINYDYRKTSGKRYVEDGLCGHLLAVDGASELNVAPTSILNSGFEEGNTT